jgi:tRNA (adenine37-N6)-methyltransferase
MVVLCVGAAAAACSTLLMLVVVDTRNRTRRQHQQELDNLAQKWSQRRQEERRGRIRAEIALRNALKKNESIRRFLVDEDGGTADNKDEPSLDAAAGDVDCTLIFPLKRIGTVVSPYTKRMGTPRQPGLVPASRGRIDLDDTYASSLLDGIEEYSHIWVLFQFHANTDAPSGCGGRSKKTKIRPPRANGQKVGQLATRSPHRPNPIGLSMVKLDRREARSLYISGLDLVHSTPVYDIKPVVPWDIPSASSLLRVPDWVSTTSDELLDVIFTDTALQQLQSAIMDAKLFDSDGSGDLYGPTNDGLTAARDTIRQILQQDPRSSHRGLKQNGRGSRGSSNGNNEKGEGGENSNYHLTLGRTKVTFRVGNDSVVQVLEITEQEFLKEQYVDGIPLLSEGLTL